MSEVLEKTRVQEIAEETSRLILQMVGSEGALFS